MEGKGMPWLQDMGNRASSESGAADDGPEERSAEERSAEERSKRRSGSETQPGDGLAAALAAVRRRGDEMLALTRAWVEINSFTANVAGVNAVAARLREAFALPALAGAVVSGGPTYGDHLIWRTPAAAREGAIVLIGHHDTVFPPGHFEGWREEAGRATGPGTLDMKGGLAVISVADEEVGSPSSTPHLHEVARGAAGALVFESGRAGDAIITRRKGVGGVTVIAHGVAAHAGNFHQDGVNAIWALAKFIDAAQQLTDYGRGCTVNVGLARGGTSKNSVDLRYETVADAQALVGALAACADAAAASVPGVRLEISSDASRLPLERTPASAALYAEYAACARAAGLGDVEAALVGGGSDANTVATLGVPAIDGLGPRGAGFHTTSEYVELASFVPKAEALVRFLWGRRAAQRRDAKITSAKF
jgi:glutamate carboxypeptidase